MARPMDPTLRVRDIVSVEHWEHYYRQGGLVTCPTGPDRNYTLEARQVWEDLFAELPHGSCIVDIGTGNGAVVLIARETAVAAGKTFEIHGVDLARISPESDVSGGAELFAGIRFHPEVDAARLPFPDSSVDALTGHYALEYTDVGATLLEARRVLRAGGCAMFVVHNSESVVVRNAEFSFGQFRLLFDETRLLRKLRRFVEAECVTPGRNRSEWLAVTGALRRVEERIAAAELPQPALLMARDLVRELMSTPRGSSLGQLNARIDRVSAELRDSWRRLSDLQRCALDEAAIDRLVAMASAVGLGRPEYRQLMHAGQHLIGWQVRFRREPDSGLRR